MRSSCGERGRWRRGADPLATPSTIGQRVVVRVVIGGAASQGGDAAGRVNGGEGGIGGTKAGFGGNGDVENEQGGKEGGMVPMVTPGTGGRPVSPLHPAAMVEVPALPTVCDARPVGQPASVRADLGLACGGRVPTKLQAHAAVGVDPAPTGGEEAQ